MYPNNSATIAYTITPAEHCATCQTVRITVSPTGEVLIERGSWDETHLEWRYQRSTTKVKRNKANAFAAGLKMDRPTTGERALRTSGIACQSPTRDGSLMIEWMEYGLHNQLDVTFDCSIQGDSELSSRLRHAPNALGLRQVAVP